MSLTDLWKTQPDQLRDKQISQLIAFAGDGKLRDGNVASKEFREFLRSIPSSLLKKYSQECLHNGFPNSGIALQDIVNEIGHRLGFPVEHGRYRGSTSTVAFDGLWKSPEHSIVVEVKTTDAYRIKLATLAGYRRRLKEEGKVLEDSSSILIVVGREDTGDLEAQIRGSRYAWDIRLISVEYLIRLLNLKEDVEDPITAKRIRAVLIPKEFTRVDEIIDLVFSATEDILQEERVDEEEREEEQEGEARDKEKRFTPVSYHEACVQRIELALEKDFLRRSRATFSTPDDHVRLVCTVSKDYERPGYVRYWYAFHPHQLDFLSSTPDSFVAFGCGSHNQVLLIPFNSFRPWLQEMRQTKPEDGRFYWHVQIHREKDGKFFLQRRRGASKPEITGFLLSDNRD